MTTLKLTRIGSPTIDTIPLEKFNNAVKRGNIVDDIIIINDIQYRYSSCEFSTSGGFVTEMIKIGSVTADDMNASPGVTFVSKTFVNAKPAGKRLVNYYSKLKTPFAGVGAPAIGFVQVIQGDTTYGGATPIPNVAGFIMNSSPILGVTPAGSNMVADMRAQINTVDPVPVGNLYTAGEMEIYIEVADLPAVLIDPPVIV